MARVGRYFAIAVAAALAACSGRSIRDEPSSESDCEAFDECEPRGGGANPGTPGGSGGSSGAGANAGGSSGAGASAGGSSGMGAAGQAGEGGDFDKTGVCGERGLAFASTAEYSGTAEMYLFSEEDLMRAMLETPICAVTFDVERVGDAPPGCVGGFSGTCTWSHLIELRNPRVTADVDGVCASHELALDDERLASLDGSRVSLGYMTDFAGHTDVLMRFDDAAGAWFEWAAAFHDPDTGIVSYDVRHGPCGY